LPGDRYLRIITPLLLSGLLFSSLFSYPGLVRFSSTWFGDKDNRGEEIVIKRPFIFKILLVLFVLTLAAPAFAGKDDWKPIDPAHLALKAPIVDKDADAEAIFWEVRVQDELEGGTPRTVLNHYIRIKIFTDRGRESQSKIDLTYLNGHKITDIAGRTIKPDGSIIELKKDAIFERTIVKVSGIKIKAKSFAMPGIEPGSIIEYRWREIRGDQLALYLRLQFQRDIPVQQVKYYIKPLSLPNFPYGMRAQVFHGPQVSFVKEKDGFSSTVLTNVPAFHEEPHMPPEDEVRPWMLIYYSEDKKLDPDQFWKEYGKESFDAYKSNMKANDDVKKMAASLTASTTTQKDKLQRLFEFCRDKIKNANDSLVMSSVEREKMKENKNPGDTLKRGVGTSEDIALLFAALANASGFDARIARLADRSDIFWNRGFPDPYFLRTYDVAVKIDNEWVFYDPTSRYIPTGMLRWQEEGQEALITDPKEPVFVRTPLSSPEKSKQKRTAKLRLSEDGTLEGDINIEFSGHFAFERKTVLDDDTPEEREKALQDRLKERMSTVEVTNIRIENITDPVKPVTYSYHVRVPGYAQRTGKRLFLQPAFFQKGVESLFSTSDRKFAIYFHYPWSEEDNVTIDLPAGYALDNASTPMPIGAGNISKYGVRLQITKDGLTLIYNRSFFFGGDGNIFFPASTYAQLKKLFDAIHESDNHTITLKQNAPASSN
jgi:hypothetical protein